MARVTRAKRFAGTTALLLAAGGVATFAIAPIRRRTLTKGLLLGAKRLKLVPRISATERAALEAGDTWIEQSLFRGAPEWDFAKGESLRAEERAFLDGPVNSLCAMVDDWAVWRDREIPQHVWAYIKAERFLGMIVPKEYGGLGFSASAHSAVIKKLHSRSIPLSISVMVPNSLGPAELLMHYGTEEQKRHYLPRLARGEELPCFALTEPEAGSDAASIQSTGEIFRGGDGKLYLRLNWEKRWITLAAISTLIGLAFRLKDPGNLLGKGTNPGITCALVPRNARGVTVDRRHDPMGVPFFNSPTTGRNVVLPLEEAVIGGVDGVGGGWTMLMESLAAGRGISLPAQSAGASAVVARVAGAHALVRRQFGLPIGRFEGVAEALGKIGGLTYCLEALRRFTCAGIDSGRRPAVVTAITKFQSTELFRQLVNHGMDIMAGAGLSLGPRNLMAHYYIGAPIGVTVEGANILTRTLIIFGQGLLRLHPFIRTEVSAIEQGDVRALDEALVGHLKYAMQSVARVLSSSAVPAKWRDDRARLERASAVFAVLAELSLLTLGGKLKLSEKLSGRFADALAWMYLARALFFRFQEDGALEEDRPFLDWGLAKSFAEIQRAFEGILSNHPAPVLGALLKRLMLPYARLDRIGSDPSDAMDLAIARLLMQPSAQRERLFDGVFVPKDPDESFARLERAMRLAAEARLSDDARLDAVQVDSFSFDEYRRAEKKAA